MTTLSINRPEYEVGDTIYYRKNGSPWYQRVVIGVTAQSYVVLGKATWDMYRGSNLPQWVKETGVNIPKTLRRGDDVYYLGTEIEFEREKWVDHNKYRITQELDWATRWGNHSEILYGVACALGLNDIAKVYPFSNNGMTGGLDERKSTGDFAGNKADDAGVAGKA